MNVIDAARSLVLFTHIIFCAFAIVTVLKADVQLILGKVSVQALHHDSQTIASLLKWLWISGISLLAIDTNYLFGPLAFDLSPFTENPKLQLKLIVVAVLTANGVVLHRFALPRLTSPTSPSRTVSSLVMAAGAVSTSHWIMAVYVGLAKALRNIAFSDLLTVYLACSGIAVGIAALVGRQALRRIGQWQTSIEPRRSDNQPKVRWLHQS